MKLLVLALVPAFLVPSSQDPAKFRLDRSEVVFLSEAPMETITARNEASSGVIDPLRRTFAVQVPMKEFKGFNSPLQREHFNENYLETNLFPRATFQGRIIEAVDLFSPGEHTVRAKGTFVVKGIAKERIVPCNVVITERGVRITATFDVALEEHAIRIPRVVHQKIASVIKVKVDMLFVNSSAK